MTVAPSRSNTLPQYSPILRALKTGLRLARQTNAERIASLSFPLPQLDPLAVLLALSAAGQRQCYFESPSRGQAIAAWDALIDESFSGRDRFQTARHSLETWQARVKSLPDRREGPYFFCSFSFFDTLTPTLAGFAPATLVLTRWQVVRHHHRCTLIANVRLSPQTRLAPLAREIAEQVGKLQAFAPGKRPLELMGWGESDLQPQLSDPVRLALQHRVRQTLGAIQAQQLQKQVIAHALDVTRSDAFRREVALPRLRSRYPDCYIFSFSGAHDSHFIGASPERLLSIQIGRASGRARV